jgi:RNA recognition motif-containing protein
MAKGLAYVDFDNEEAAQEALKTNGLVIDGRRLFVALSDPPKKG